jgi:hypothetical protein
MLRQITEAVLIGKVKAKAQRINKHEEWVELCESSPCYCNRRVIIWLYEVLPFLKQKIDNICATWSFYYSFLFILSIYNMAIYWKGPKDETCLKSPF